MLKPPSTPPITRNLSPSVVVIPENKMNFDFERKDYLPLLKLPIMPSPTVDGSIGPLCHPPSFIIQTGVLELFISPAMTDIFISGSSESSMTPHDGVFFLKVT